PSRLMAETAEELRRSLAALRLERGTAKPPARRPRWLPIGVVIAVALLAVAGVRLARGRTASVDVVRASVPAVGDGAAGVPVLSGAGYVVSADRYIAIGVRVAGRIDRYMVEEGD